MLVQNLTTPLKEIAGGSAALVLCMVMYLVWWIIVFKPDGHSTVFSTICIVLATLAGLGGVLLCLAGMNDNPATRANLPGPAIGIAGIVIYFALLALTALVMKRQVTTELILIVGWCVLELCIINSLYGSGQFGLTLSVILAVVLLVAVIVFLICYLQYYKLEGAAGWIDGMIPLAAGALYEIATVIAVLVTA